MRSIFTLLLTLALTSAAFPQDGAPFGRLLAKKYPAMSGDETAVVIIYLKDKGDRARTALYTPRDLLTTRAIARRARVRPENALIDERDLPLEPSYVGGVSARVMKVRHTLKWFNAVTAEATAGQIDALSKLPFVREIELVGRWRARFETETPAKNSAPSPPVPFAADSLDYGSSLTQNAQIRVPDVHDLGIYGEGVVVGVFDNGFRLLSHEAFDSMNIIAQYDFVDYKESVIPNNTAGWFGAHGVNTLSTVGGYKPGQLIGPAFRAGYILARTENDSSETPLEEDKWAAAIEWADSIGVDVTSTSLGYLDYQSPYTSWTWEDMDGNTTLITRAADHAVGLGIVVVNSAGNQGAAGHNTLMGPADGDSVIAAGAVGSDGSRVSFSSIGPTTDDPPRVKPDVMAMGVSVRVASSSNPTSYGSSSGTSFSCPLTAGVAALVLSANPSLTPMQVRDAMRNTADNAASPDNYYGWGILNADSAVRYWGITPMAMVSGTVFHDLDGNGLFDGDDTVLAGRTVRLSGPLTDSVVTGAGGAYSFTSLPIGTYTLTTATDPGWITTTPVESLTLRLLHRDDVTDAGIGIFQTGTIAGTVFNDEDSNGVKGPSEAWLGGRVVRLVGALNDSVITDAAGAYEFTGLLPGSYGVRLDPETGWVQSLPAGYGDYPVTVSSGFGSGGYDFGTFLAAGMVFSVNGGWNLLSLPVGMALPLADSVYPMAVSPVFVYDAGYTSVDTIPNGRGYWVKFPGPQNILLPGGPRTADTLDLGSGWNLVGTLSAPVAVQDLVQEPDTLLGTDFYSFAGNAYVKLAPGDTLIPHTGYWVKCRVAGQLIMTATPPGE